MERNRLKRMMMLATLTLIFALMLAAPALAAPADDGLSIPITDFLPLDSLITYGGALAATILLVQLFKGLIPIETRLLSCLVALTVLNGAALGLKLWDWQFAVWSIFNCVVIGFAASGTYDAYQRLRYGTGAGEDKEPQGDEPEEGGEGT